MICRSGAKIGYNKSDLVPARAEDGKVALNSSAMLVAEYLQKFVILELEFQEEQVVMARMDQLLPEKEQVLLAKKRALATQAEEEVILTATPGSQMI